MTHKAGEGVIRGCEQGGGGADQGGAWYADEDAQSNQQQLKRVSTQIQQSKLLKDSARLKKVLGQRSNLKYIFVFWFCGL